MSSRASGIISDYFQKNPTGARRVFLLLDEHPVTRNGIRKFLTDHGVLHANVHATDNLSDAKDLIHKVRPNCLIGSQRFNGATLIEVMDHLFLETRLSPTETWIGCIPTLAMSEVTARLASDARTDFILPRPFTLEGFSQVILSLIQRKPDEAKARTEFHEVHPFTSQLSQLETLGQLDSARLRAESLNKRYPHSLPVRMAMDRLRFKEAFHPNRADAVFLAFEEAHRLQLLHPAWVPDLLRWTIEAGRSEIFDLLLQIALDLPPEENPKELKGQLAQGMIQWAEKQLKNSSTDTTSKKEALEWIRKSLRISEANLETYRPILALLKGFGLYPEIEVLLAASPAEVRESIESQVVYLHFLDATHQSVALVERSQDLIHRKIRAPEIYAFLIQHSRRLNRPERVIQGIIQEASAFFPSEKALFEKS